MKLASLKNSRRDGRLVVVDRALTRMRPVPHLATTLQAALDDWSTIAPALQRVQLELEDHPRRGIFRSIRHFLQHPCRALTTGQTAVLTSTMSSWSAKHAAQKCLQVSGQIHSSIKAALTTC